MINNNNNQVVCWLAERQNNVYRSWSAVAKGKPYTAIILVIIQYYLVITKLSFPTLTVRLNGGTWSHL